MFKMSVYNKYDLDTNPSFISNVLIVTYTH